MGPTGVDDRLTAIQAVFTIEQLPFRELDPAIVLATVAAWVQEHDEFRERFELPDPEYAVTPNDEKTADSKIQLAFTEPLLVITSWAPSTGSARALEGGPYDIWVAEQIDLNVGNTVHHQMSAAWPRSASPWTVAALRSSSATALSPKAAQAPGVAGRRQPEAGRPQRAPTARPNGSTWAPRKRGKRKMLRGLPNLLEIHAPTRTWLSCWKFERLRCPRRGYRGHPPEGPHLPGHRRQPAPRTPGDGGKHKPKPARRRPASCAIRLQAPGQAQPRHPLDLMGWITGNLNAAQGRPAYQEAQG